MERLRRGTRPAELGPPWDRFRRSLKSSQADLSLLTDHKSQFVELL